MYLARIPDAPAEEIASLTDIKAALGSIAGGIDARFVEAGTALARAYEIVERLVGALEGVTNALDHEAADAAIAKMRMTADRLMRLPEVQVARAEALGIIQKASIALRSQVAQVNRLLAFLRICGLNIKVASAGMKDFSDFADTIFTTLELGEAEMSDILREIEQLAKSIPGVLDIERGLAAECAQVIPHVPLKLAKDALALQQHQTEAASRAVRIADVARDVRTRVATALGALQIGDITRQRLEHVADCLGRLDAFVAGRPDISILGAEAIRGHMFALLAAQAEDAAQDLARESALLMRSVRAILPGAETLLELKAAGTDDEGASPLHVVERSVADVARVTGQLQHADARSNRLSNAASETAGSLAKRLSRIQRLTNDVQHMAWNTDLRCYRMGAEGRALATIASEIRGFANRIEAVSAAISDLFDQLAAAAGSICDPEGADPDAGQALADSLACIRTGGDRLRAGLLSLDCDASAVSEILSGTTDKIDCEGVNTALSGIVAQLAAFAAPSAELPEDAVAPLGELLDTLARSYTMAREREVHSRFAPTDDATAEAAPTEAGADDDDFDDGLF